MRIYIIGSLNMDLVIRAPRVPEAGETLSGEGFMTNPGGKGANQAVAVAKAGGEAYMVGCVGREFGKELSDALTQYGVHTDYVRAEEDVSSGIAVIVVADGDNRIILDAGSNARADEALVDRALATAQAGDYLLLQLEIPLSTVGYALKRAKERGMITVLNPAPAAKLGKAALACCDWFTPNQTEAQFYTGIFPSDEESIRACAEKLRLGGGMSAFTDRSREEAQRTREQQERLASGMEHASAFIREAFGDGQELTVLLTGFTEHPVCRELMKRECPELWQEAGRQLDAEGREEELRRKLQNHAREE